MKKALRDFDLSGKVIVVTGGGGFLGKAFGEALSDYGASVILVDHDYAACEEAVMELNAKHDSQVCAYQIDVGNLSSVKKVFKDILKRFGRIDVLINNAATRSMGFFNAFESYSVSDWEEVFRVNVTGVFLCSQVAGNYMLAQGSGSIINIASIYSVVAPDPGIYEGTDFNGPAVYSASKGAVVSLTRHLAAYWGKKGIRVNAISPGGVQNKHATGFIKRYSNKVPLGRMGKKNDLRGVIIFLASGSSSYVTGQNILVDGGLTSW